MSLKYIWGNWDLKRGHIVGDKPESRIQITVPVSFYYYYIVMFSFCWSKVNLAITVSLIFYLKPDWLEEFLLHHCLCIFPSHSLLSPLEAGVIQIPPLLWGPHWSSDCKGSIPDLYLEDLSCLWNYWPLPSPWHVSSQQHSPSSLLPF